MSVVTSGTETTLKVTIQMEKSLCRNLFLGTAGMFQLQRFTPHGSFII